MSFILWWGEVLWHDLGPSEDKEVGVLWILLYSEGYGSIGDCLAVLVVEDRDNHTMLSQVSPSYNCGVFWRLWYYAKDYLWVCEQYSDDLEKFFHEYWTKWLWSMIHIVEKSHQLHRVLSRVRCNHLGRMHKQVHRRRKLGASRYLFEDWGVCLIVCIWRGFESVNLSVDLGKTSVIVLQWRRFVLFLEVLLSSCRQIIYKCVDILPIKHFFARDFTPPPTHLT